MNNAVIVLCSRVKSSRLPRKVFKKIAQLPALDHILLRLSKIGPPVILAVPETDVDEYKPYADRYKDFVTLTSGQDDSPLHRTAEAVVNHAPKAEWIIRVTHDDILIDPTTARSLLYQCQNSADVGYGISPGIVEGAGVEVIHRDNLFHASSRRKEPTEFISYFVKNGPRKKSVLLPPRPSVNRPYRLTLDYPEDAVALEAVLREAGAAASLDEVVEVLDRTPAILDINRLPLVSFYTCAYNAEHYLAEAIETVLACPVSMEYIIVDDCSQDRTLTVAARYGADHRIKIIANEENLGLAESSNIAIARARGKYVLRLDADDLLLNQKVEALVDYAEARHYDIVYPGYDRVALDGIVIEEHCSPRCHHHAGGALMRRGFINEIRFGTNLRHWDSLELYNRIQDRAGNIGYWHEPTWVYRHRPDSMSNTNLEERARLKP